MSCSQVDLSRLLLGFHQAPTSSMLGRNIVLQWLYIIVFSGLHIFKAAHLFGCAVPHVSRKNAQYMLHADTLLHGFDLWLTL